MKRLRLGKFPNPFEEVDIEKLAFEKYPIDKAPNEGIQTLRRTAFEVDYKAAKSDKQFTLDDMMRAYTQGHNDTYDSCYVSTENPCGAETVELSQGNFDELTEKYFTALSTQQLPNEFIPECNLYLKARNSKNCPKGSSYDERMPKVIINSEGKQELVGTYRY